MADVTEFARVMRLTDGVLPEGTLRSELQRSLDEATEIIHTRLTDVTKMPSATIRDAAIYRLAGFLFDGPVDLGRSESSFALLRRCGAEQVLAGCTKVRRLGVVQLETAEEED